MSSKLDDAVRRLGAGEHTLTEVILHGDRHGDRIGAEGAMVLADAICANSAVTSLDLANNKIGAKGAVALANTLHTNSTVTDLNLYRNKIGPEGVVALADVLSTNSVVRNLNLACNKIGAKGATALAGALSTNFALTVLGLGGNKIGGEGVTALSAALRTNYALAILGLGGNEIGAKGAMALADTVRINAALTEIDLGGNEIGTEGAAALAGALCTNSTLARLGLECNGIGAEGARALVDSLRTNFTVTWIGLKGNEFGTDLETTVDRLVEINRESFDPQEAARKKADEFGPSPAELGEAKERCHMLMEEEGHRKGNERCRSQIEVEANFHMGCHPTALLPCPPRTASLVHPPVVDAEPLDQWKESSTTVSEDKGASTTSAAEMGGSNFFCGRTVDSSALCPGDNAVTEVVLEKAEQVLTPPRKTEILPIEEPNSNDVLFGRGGLINAHTGTVQFCEIVQRVKPRYLAATKKLEKAHIAAWIVAEIRGMDPSGRFLKKDLDSGLWWDIGDYKALKKTRQALKDEAPDSGLKHNSETAASINPSVKLLELQREHSNKEVQLRQNVKSYQEKRVAEEGISYFISVERSKPFQNDCASLGVKQLVWNADRVKQAAAGDGSSLSGLLIALQWIVGKYSRGKECPIKVVLPRPPAEISLALKTPEALKTLVDRKLNGDEPSILHIVCGAEDDCALQVSRMLVEDLGAEFDGVKDSLGRSARTIALANNNPQMIAWARRVGTLFGRYKIDQGPPVHKSATCKVVSATDVAGEATEQPRVALKIVTERIQFEHELGMRLVHKPYSGVDISPDLNRFQEAHVLKLHRYHIDMDDNSDERVMCFVMPLAARSLDDIIRAEHVAGRELFLIKHFAVAAARALQHLHSDHGIVHADFKPRNVVRLGSQFKLIDFDSSVRIGDPVGTGNVSTGYCPPELANVIFSQDEGLEQLKQQRDEMRSHLASVQCPNTVRTIVELNLKSTEEKIAQLEAGERDPPTAHPSLDIWSFGVVMFYMITGACLFQCDVADNLVGTKEECKLVQWKGLRKDHLRSVLTNCPGATGAEIRAAKNMLRKCLEPNPCDRPQSMAELLRMPFLDSSAKSGWTPGEKNSIRFLFSDPLVWKKDGEFCPIERLNFEWERDLLVECLKNVKKDIKLSFDAATVSRLQELADTRCGCLHFSGHGEPSFLVFEDGYGGAHFLGVDGIQKLIPRREAFNFVFVAACLSQVIGQAFVDAGVPHVLCCEQESLLSNGAAAQFIRAFYCQLAKGSTIKVAFDSAVGAVSVSNAGEGESQKYVLLPSDEDHDITIFDADDVDAFDEENKIETTLPAPPVGFEGHQICIYEIVSEVLYDFGQKHFIFLVGKNHILRRNMLSAACHYIKDRLSTSPTVDSLLYVKPNTVGCEDSDASLLQLLYKQLIPEGQATCETNDSVENSICKVLEGLKMLIVFDIMGDADSLCGLLHSLCGVAGRVKVLLAAEKESAFSYPATQKVLYVDKLSKVQ